MWQLFCCFYFSFFWISIYLLAGISCPRVPGSINSQVYNICIGLDPGPYTLLVALLGYFCPTTKPNEAEGKGCKKGGKRLFFLGGPKEKNSLNGLLISELYDTPQFPKTKMGNDSLQTFYEVKKMDDIIGV